MGTSKEFRAFYVDEHGEKGWTELWRAAGPELRPFTDGRLRTFEDFRHSYGVAQALIQWDAAKSTTNVTSSLGWWRMLWNSIPKPERAGAKPEFHGERGQVVSACACKGARTI